MRALTLARYDLKRLARHKALWITLFAVPLAAGLLRAAFAHAYWSLACAWSAPLVCALLTIAVLAGQRAADRLSGLDAGLRTTPLSDSALLASRIIAGSVVYVLQMAILVLILAVRF